jgi:hypothetical protein
MTYVPVELRNRVIQRANHCCEYCKIHDEDTDIRFHIEHIIATTHGGKSIFENLALSCSKCNWFKGSNIAAADPLTDEPTFLFHPRRHNWNDHFLLDDVIIQPITPEGRATVFILRLNEPERIEQRELLIMAHRYPCGDN